MRGEIPQTKKESQKCKHLEPVVTIPRPHSPNPYDSFSDIDMTYMQTYFSELLSVPLAFTPSSTIENFHFFSVNMTRLEQCFGWLSFGCGSACLLNAMLPIAVMLHKRRVL
jgi:hypothetical protein